ncbi:unnamed protein product [Mycena citricolor]|uniref:F-box domain-containing protein n=1 Tax=Mycena citricolor TaxID=2018698 RepID=A0AAD2HLU6_9AGAR|nr:unnamed protein product [Mycena citricolor]
MGLFQLPTELIVYAFGFLSRCDLDSCSNVCTTLHDLISSSANLQFLRSAEIAGVEGNPLSPLGAIERLQRLNAREAAYQQARPAWVCSVPVPFQSSSIYELSGETFWLGEAGRRAVWYLRLPRVESATPVWQRIAVSSPDRHIVDFGLSVEENDLLVLATLDTEFTLRLEFVSVLTGNRHPAAKDAIDVTNTQDERCSLILEVAGDHIIVIASYPLAHRPDCVWLYNWKTGTVKFDLQAVNHTYSGAVFLSTDVFLLANAHTACFELWQISEEQPPSEPALVLHLPRLSLEHRIWELGVRGEPSPARSRAFQDRAVPFSSVAEEAIIVFRIMFRGPGPSCRLLLFIHRHALLALLSSPDVSEMHYPVWGPDICRWINMGALVPSWITIASGQRCVLSRQIRNDFILLDFNADPERERPLATVLPPEDTFSEPVRGLWTEPVASRLPCSVQFSERLSSGFEGMSLSDSHIIAMKRNQATLNIESVDVLFFG